MQFPYFCQSNIKLGLFNYITIHYVVKTRKGEVGGEQPTRGDQKLQKKKEKKGWEQDVNGTLNVHINVNKYHSNIAIVQMESYLLNKFPFI